MEHCSPGSESRCHGAEMLRGLPPSGNPDAQSAAVKHYQRIEGLRTEDRIRG